MMMTIGLLVWGMQAKIIYGGYCKRSYVSRFEKRHTSSFEWKDRERQQSHVQFSKLAPDQIVK
jgi:hypothetical protein